MSRWLLGALVGPPLLLTVWLVGGRWLLDECGDWANVVQAAGLPLSAALGTACFWRAAHGPPPVRDALSVPYVLLALYALVWYTLAFVGLFYGEYL